jgi:hypothetical protein
VAPIANHRRQRCYALRTNGERCRNYPAGTWHVCRYHDGEPLAVPKPCHCRAYQWPHRCGSGVCRWPEEPTTPCPTPLGTRKYHSRKRAWIYKWRKLIAAAKKADRAATIAAFDHFQQLQRDLEAIAAKAIEGSDFAPRASAMLPRRADTVKS